MNHTSKRMRFLATRLIMHEANASEFKTTENQQAAEVIQKLRPQLVELMGNMGFQALVSRSLALVQEEAPGLAGARLNPDGRLDGFDDSPESAQLRKNSTGGSVLLAKILGLLSSVIGELLTVQIVTEVFPKLPLDGYFTQGV